jgi:hypothetical protein
MKSIIILSMILGSAVAFASKQKPMSKSEVDAVNFILQCPDEVLELNKKGARVQTGGTFNDRTVTDGRNYNFFRRNGWTSTEYVSTLTVSRVRRLHGPSDAPSYTVSCEITDQSK